MNNTIKNSSNKIVLLTISIAALVLRLLPIFFGMFHEIRSIVHYYSSMEYYSSGFVLQIAIQYINEFLAELFLFLPLILFCTSYQKYMKTEHFATIVFGLNSLIIFSGGFFGIRYIMGIVLSVLFMITAILAMISLIKGYNIKVILPVAIGYQFIFLLVRNILIFDWYYLYKISCVTDIISYILFAVILYLLVLQPQYAIKSKSESFDIEKELKRLDAKLEIGLITQEEYKLLRNEIVSKL